MYTYYVVINGISEELFWYSEYNVLLTILEDKHAYMSWKNYMEEKMIERRRSTSQQRSKRNISRENNGFYGRNQTG